LSVNIAPKLNQPDFPAVNDVTSHPCAGSCLLFRSKRLILRLEVFLCYSHLMVWKDDLGLFSKLSPSFSTCSSLSRGVFALPFITSSPEPQNLTGKQTPEEKRPKHCGRSNTSGSRGTQI